MKNGLLLLVLLCTVPIVKSQSLFVNPVSTNDSSKFILGGYGSILFNYMDYGPNRMLKNGAEKENRSIVDLPRMIVSMDYKFRNGFGISAEIEYEHGGTGSTIEYEYEESGEWEQEIEKGGEIVLEQFYLSKYFCPEFSIKVGHMVVPVGLTNKSHLPTQFFGSSRPEGENTIIPLTWHETGVSILGNIGKWGYEAQIVNGLDANGMSSAYWIRKARQTQYEFVKITDPAYVLRVNNRSIRNLTLGASFYHGNSTANSSKPEKMEHIDGTVTIGTFDAVYNDKNLIFRGNALYGNLSDSKEIYKLNLDMLSRTSPYSRTPVAKNALSYSAELGYNIFKPLRIKGKLFPFVRYEYYHSMYEVEDGVSKDERYERSILSFGFNYFPIKNLVIKADFARRKIADGGYNNENTFGISVGYYGIFAKM